MSRGRVAGLLLALTLASAAAGCSEDEGGGAPATSAAAPRQFTNPVLDGNLADPHVLKCDLPTKLWGQRLDRDGLALVGKPVRLGARNDAEWEGTLIEAPTLWREGDTYYLLFSANDYGSSLYAVGYATAKRVLGPYRDAPENPILASGTGVANGPGGQAIVRGPGGGLWFAYHAWGELVGDDAGGQRSLWLDRPSFENGRPRVAGPTDTPQEAP